MVFGVCAAIEEEKDPRCLLLVFRIVELLTLVFPDSDGPVADCAEDLFDIVSRYFPISFNPVRCSKNFAKHTKIPVLLLLLLLLQQPNSSPFSILKFYGFRV